MTTFISYVTKVGKAVADNPSRHAFWEGILDGLSGPLLMSLKLKVPVPSKSKSGKQELVSGLSHSPDLELVNVRLSAAMNKAFREVAAARGIALETVAERELDSSGKLREVSRLKARQLANDGGSSE